MQFYRIQRKRAEVPIVPMIDILFVLLVFIIVSTTFKKKRHTLRIDFPTVKEVPSDQVSDTRSVIAVDAVGNITLDGLEVPEGGGYVWGGASARTLADRLAPGEEVSCKVTATVLHPGVFRLDRCRIVARFKGRGILAYSEAGIYESFHVRGYEV